MIRDRSIGFQNVAEERSSGAFFFCTSFNGYRLHRIINDRKVAIALAMCTHQREHAVTEKKCGQKGEPYGKKENSSILPRQHDE